MRVTTIGHAGLFIEAGGATILCDPWFNPAYLGSWMPFPRNDTLAIEAIASPDFLYVSHLHLDHYDPTFLKRHVDKRATVVLPHYALPLLEDALKDLGFGSFLRTQSGVPHDLGTLELTVVSLPAPTDGPIGDSALVVRDSTSSVLNMNDARPTDLSPFTQHGRPDLLFLQTSGAIWYPMVYDFAPPRMEALGRRKREAGMERALWLIDLLDPRFVVPFAGPPCFLDAELWDLNDFDNDPSNTFPDQKVFLDVLHNRTSREGRLMIPGSVGELNPDGFEVVHPMSQTEVDSIFADKRTYLTAYQGDWIGAIEAQKSTWSHPEVDVAARIKEWFEPLMNSAERLCAEIGGTVLLDFGDPQLLLDFRDRSVSEWTGQDWDHRFTFDRAIGEHLVHDAIEDWVNDTFLSCRFKASRNAQHNDAVFTFFKCLSPQRMEYAENWLSEQEQNEESIQIGQWRVQRRCPHAKADLTRFGVVANGTLVCHLHGYEFDLASGRCLTNERFCIEAEEIADPAVTT